MKQLLLGILLATVVACGNKSGGGSAKTVASSDDYMSVGTDLANKMMDIFKGTDCDKVAKDMTSFMDSNKATIDSLKAWEKAHADDKKKFDDKMGEAMKDKMGPMIELATKCKDNKGFMDAMSKLDDK